MGVDLKPGVRIRGSGSNWLGYLFQIWPYVNTQTAMKERSFFL